MTVEAYALIMGMPVSLNVVDAASGSADTDAVFSYLRHIDQVFSTYRGDSETERINRGEVRTQDHSNDMRSVIDWCERTKAETRGYFDAHCMGRFDPSGIVKGYAIKRAADLLKARGLHNYFVEAGGDIQTAGHNRSGENWRVGIQDPFDASRLLKVVNLSGEGIATSGMEELVEALLEPGAKALWH